MQTRLIESFVLNREQDCEIKCDSALLTRPCSPLLHQGLESICGYPCWLHPSTQGSPERRGAADCTRRARSFCRDLGKPWCGDSATTTAADQPCNIGKGDFAHIRELLYNGIDVVIGVFSLADAGSLTWLEKMLRNEVDKMLQSCDAECMRAVQVSKRVDGAPIILVGTKQDLRDSRQEVPAVGHSIPGALLLQLEPVLIG